MTHRILSFGQAITRLTGRSYTSAVSDGDNYFVAARVRRCHSPGRKFTRVPLTINHRLPDGCQPGIAETWTAGCPAAVQLPARAIPQPWPAARDQSAVVVGPV